jgi:proline iminopeptidase
MEEGFEFESHTEKLNGVELYFEVAGPKDAAQTLIYLHGLGYNSYSFREIMGEHLGAYRVVYLDQRGCGRSAPLEADPELFTVDALVDDLEALRAHLNLRSFTPIGHAFGAVIALEYTRRFPRHVSSVVAVSPWVHFPELATQLLDVAMRLTERTVDVPEDPEARADLAFSLREDLLSVLYFPNPQARLHLEFVDTESGLFGSGTAQEAFIFNRLWELEYPLYFPEIQSPVICIAGEMDATVNPGQSDWLVDLLGAELEIMEGGHYPWLENAAGFVDALERLLP